MIKYKGRNNADRFEIVEWVFPKVMKYDYGVMTLSG